MQAAVVEASEWSPVVNGLRIGQIVEIRGAGAGGDAALEGELGQLVNYLPEVDRLRVALISNGQRIQLEPAHVVSAGPCKGPGAGGGPESFDLVLGPRTNRESMADSISDCLGQKGFCVLKVIQATEELAEAFEVLKDCEQRGELGRLAREVEEGYLGRNGRAKATWLDPDGGLMHPGGLLARSDANITALAEALQPRCGDCAGALIQDRTPSLACLSMSDMDEADYEHPTATDQTIYEFYSTWVRSVLRVIHFLGPARGVATLTTKPGAPTTLGLAQSLEVSASAGTILIFREDTFEYAYEEPEDGEACWLQAFLMKPGAQWALGELRGDALSLLRGPAEGPAPPPPDADNLVAVTAISIQSCGRMTDHHKEWAAYFAGCDGHLEMPVARFDYLPFYGELDDDMEGTTYVKHFSVQDGIELFDNRLFEISHKEASCMDPQCRQVLEVGYLSMHQLGITKKDCNLKPIHASVSVGLDKQEWMMMTATGEAPASIGTNNQLAITANRFNYVFNLKGGSFVCDTACSSSLVAAHLGKVNLLERRWDPLEWHLGCGTALTLTVHSFVHSCAARMLSQGGRCFTFDRSADGYNRGDGTAALVLQAGALEERRLVLFRGSQIGQDGRSAGMSAPNGPAQEKCILGAMREARMTPSEATVWECHGTGTALGDPIEVGGVRKVQTREKRLDTLLVATSKSNFGHLEGSAAAISMNKCILVVLRNACTATQHLRVLNAHLSADFDAHFVTEMATYSHSQTNCHVSSFGVGGTNGHAIFWGEAYRPPIDVQSALTNKMLSAVAPIIVHGSDPSAWEYSGPPLHAAPDEEYRIVFTRDPLTGRDDVRYERVHKEEQRPPEFYALAGNYNGWIAERMPDGRVPHLFQVEVSVPSDGLLAFRVLEEADPARAIGPEATSSDMTAPIVGPRAGLTTSWEVQGTPGQAVRIEWFCPPPAHGHRVRTVAWLSAMGDG